MKNKFEASDIFDYKDANKYDLVVSLGVLHHTKSARQAFKELVKVTKPGGYIVIGLYHKYGRIIETSAAEKYWNKKKNPKN